MAEPAERCPERERLLWHWTDCSTSVTKLLDEQLAAMKSSAPSFAGFEDQIRLARGAETEACRKYFGHVNTCGAPLFSHRVWVDSGQRRPLGV
jgi:hypothetical protein